MGLRFTFELAIHHRIRVDCSRILGLQACWKEMAMFCLYILCTGVSGFADGEMRRVVEAPMTIAFRLSLDQLGHLS